MAPLPQPSAPSETGDRERTSARNIAWSWSLALFGALCAAAPAVVVAGGDPSKGLALGVGALPAVAIGLQPERRKRFATVVVGGVFAVFLVLGSLLSQSHALAVVGMFVVPLAAAVLASRRPLGLVALMLAAPLIAVGLSYEDLDKAVEVGLLLVVGSLAATLISLAWPERPPVERPRPTLMSRDAALRYGARLGLAAASAVALSYAVGTDHPGWAPAAVLFIMRPQEQMHQLRSWGRVISVFVGGLIGAWLLSFDPPYGVLALSLVSALACSAATHGSRWYVSPLFSTFLVILLLLVSDYSAAAAHWRFAERFGWTVVGAGLAYLFGLLLPRLLQRARTA
jgi:hypothetical protein